MEEEEEELVVMKGEKEEEEELVARKGEEEKEEELMVGKKEREKQGEENEVECKGWGTSGMSAFCVSGESDTCSCSLSRSQ